MIDKKYVRLAEELGENFGQGMGEEIKDILVDSFKEAGKEAKKVGVEGVERLNGKESSEKKDGEKVDAKLSPKTIFLRAARSHASASMSQTHKKFDAKAGELKRLPVETLHSLSGAFDRKVIEGVTTEFKSSLVREWVNFGKAAAEHGEDARDKDKMPSHPSKLDQVLSPYGVLQISVKVDQVGKVKFQKAVLPDVGDAVLADIRGQPGGLASLGLNRTITIDPENATEVSTGRLTVDTNGVILNADPSKMPLEKQIMYANVLKRAPGTGGLTPGEVIAGMYGVLASLNDVPRSKIDAGES